MATITENYNLFQPTGFRVIIDRTNYPNFAFFARSVTHPGATLQSAEAPQPRVATVPFAGDAITFGELTISILLNEDFEAYEEIYSWMRRLIETNYVSQYDALNTGEIASHADISIIALTSHNNNNKTIIYRDAVPTGVGDIQFESGTDGIDYILTPMSFRFSYFDIV